MLNTCFSKHPPDYDCNARTCVVGILSHGKIGVRGMAKNTSSKDVTHKFQFALFIILADVRILAENCRKTRAPAGFMSPWPLCTP